MHALYDVHEKPFTPTLLATVDELSGVNALCGDEELCPLLEPVRVTEGHFGQGGATAGVVDNVLRR